MSGKLFPCRQSFFCHLFWFPLFTVTFTDVDANEQNKGCSYFAQLCQVGLLHCNLVFLGADRKLSWHFDRVGFLQVSPTSKNIFIRSILKTSMSCLAVKERVKMFWLNWSSINNCSFPRHQATPDQKAKEVTCWLVQAYDELLEGWDSTEGESYSERYHVRRDILKYRCIFLTVAHPHCIITTGQW